MEKLINNTSPEVLLIWCVIAAIVLAGGIVFLVDFVKGYDEWNGGGK